MDYPSIIEFLLIFAFAGTKFAMALGYMLLPTTNYSYLEMVATLISGGTTGVVFFYYFTNWVNIQLNKLFKSKKKKKIFTKGTRRFLTIKNKYGLIGIAALTPILLSVPLGCFLASRFYAGKKYTLPVMIAGIIFWAFVLPLIRLSY